MDRRRIQKNRVCKAAAKNAAERYGNSGYRSTAAKKGSGEAFSNACGRSGTYHGNTDTSGSGKIDRRSVIIVRGRMGCSKRACQGKKGKV